MPKGLFTQSAAILLEGPVHIDTTVACLESMHANVRHSDDTGWMGGSAAIVPMRPDVNGAVLVDVVSQPWPDAMGHPQDEPELFAAWTMGWFGPFVFPENLSRAVQMAFGWDGAAAATDRHRAFVRIKSSYVLGAADNAPVLPDDYDALVELEFVTTVARSLMHLPGALAYFNPNGEILQSASGLDSTIEWHRQRELPPLPAWSNVRLFRLDEGWTLMDTIGMEQLDVNDHEACFLGNRYDPEDVANFLRNSTDYVRQMGPIIEDGNTMDGPGGIRWTARTIEESITARPRTVLRWMPMDDRSSPAMLAQ